MNKIAVVILLLSSTAVLAQEPTEERKIWALKRAYQINGNSMVRWGSIDLTKEQPGSTVVRIIPIVPPPEKPFK
jgi:hypothetical protein